MSHIASRWRRAERLPMCTLLGGMLAMAAGGAAGCSEGPCEFGDERYDVGESFPAGDGCNTCTCEANGDVSCTLIGCRTDGGLFDAGSADSGVEEASVGDADTADADTPSCVFAGERYDLGTIPAGDCNTCRCVPPGHVECTRKHCGADDEGCDTDGGHYAAGEPFAAADGCNTCACTAPGELRCTQHDCERDAGVSVDAGCPYGDITVAVGDSVPCTDACNTCMCYPGDERLSQTLVACSWSTPRIQRCHPDAKSNVTFEKLYLNGHVLALDVDDGGRCYGSYDVCYRGVFFAGAPAEAELLVEGSPGESPGCLSGASSAAVWSLEPLAEAWRSTYGADAGSVALQVGDEHTRYSF